MFDTSPVRIFILDCILMVKDPQGVYHHCDGYLDKRGEPVFLSPTKCGRDWENEEGWWVVYFLDADLFGHLICEECTNGN